MSLDVRRLWETGRATFPKVALELSTFSRFLDALGPSNDVASYAADLFLACACAENEPPALAHFERELMPDAADAVRRVDASADFVDEVTQEIRTRLLVSTTGSPPRIGEYAGRGPLAGWLRSVAVRTALNAQERRAARVRGTAAVPPPSAGQAPYSLELELLKKQYGPAFSAALRSAMTSLSERDRVVFRMHYLEGVPVTGIAQVLRVDRTTVTRWMTRAKDALRSQIVQQLRTRLALVTSDVESLSRALERHLDVSLGTLLREATP